MMAAVPNPPNDKKRVKVYELRSNDWFDKGTGFCEAKLIWNDATSLDEPIVRVHSEEEPDKLILETKICKDDGFQKQQDTLIVWTEPHDGKDMALSFQEADGCAAIWSVIRRFVAGVQHHLMQVSGPGDDALSDELPIENLHTPLTLPRPTLGSLPEIEASMRSLSNTQMGRDALGKYIMSENYIRDLIPLLEMAEDLEDLGSLHRLCTIFKIMILLNDTLIIEHVVTDNVILGAVGALEYDPDFPSHKANHRHWLSNKGRFKEVVRIDDESVQRKIHQTYRLQYLKDVVLARILDDPTFSVLNSLIFFNQVDIVQHLQTNGPFLKELFSIFAYTATDEQRKKEAVLFIQQCCAVAKGLQTPGRQQLYNNFLGHGLLSVINFALRHADTGVRVGATDVLVCMIDHDPQMIRQTIFRQISEKQTPLTDSLIDLLLVETDLGVKAQIADAIKVLLDPGSSQGAPLELSKMGNDFARTMRDPQHDIFLNSFYEESAKRLFKPLVDLENRPNMDFTAQQVSIFIYLIEILCFFIRQHATRSKAFVMNEHLAERISQLLSCKEKYMKLTVLKFFRNLVGLHDDFYQKEIMRHHLFEPILALVEETMHRDSLLNSACLELFDFIRDKHIKVFIAHLVVNYRERLGKITYVEMFKVFIDRYDASHGFVDTSFMETDDETPRRSEGRGRWESGVKDLDADEEAYFNTSDDEEELKSDTRTSINDASPLSKPLVDYLSDEDNDAMDTEKSTSVVADRAAVVTPLKESSTEDKGDITPAASPVPATPPERLSEKRRREDDEDEDELGKLSSHAHKRQASISSVSSSPGGNFLKRKGSLNGASKNVSKTKTIAIQLSPSVKTGGEGDDNEG